MCGRINRSLVKDRDRFFTVAMKPTLPTAYEVNQDALNVNIGSNMINRYDDGSPSRIDQQETNEDITTEKSLLTGEGSHERSRTQMPTDKMRKLTSSELRSRRQNLQVPRQNSSVHSSMYLESGYNKSMVTSGNILETLAKRRT